MLYICHEEKTISFSGCWLPSAKFLLLTGLAEGTITGGARTEQAVVTFMQASPSSPWGWLSQWLLWPQAAAAHLSGSGDKRFSMWCSGFLTCLLLTRLCLISSLRHFFLLSLLCYFPSAVAFLPTTHLHFFPFLFLFLFYLPYFSYFSLLPNHTHHFLPFWFFSQGLNHSSSVCEAVCMAQSNLPQSEAISCGRWPS